MASAQNIQVASMPVASDLSIADLGRALAAGWRDFRAQSAYGLFFSAIFVGAGWFLFLVLKDRESLVWLILAMAGFPMLAPFAAAGLYEVSRRLESGEPVRLKPVLSAVRGRGDDQLPVLGMIAFVFFAFWVIIAHTIFGVFLGLNGLGADTLTVLASGPGIAMLCVGSGVGAILAFTFFAMTVISMPLLIDREADFISAIIVSFRVVRANLTVMLAWGLFVAVALFAAMLPLFLGLFLVLPLLGHATWHLYRRAAGASA